MRIVLHIFFFFLSYAERSTASSAKNKTAIKLIYTVPVLTTWLSRNMSRGSRNLGLLVFQFALARFHDSLRDSFKCPAERALKRKEQGTSSLRARQRLGWAICNLLRYTFTAASWWREYARARAKSAVPSFNFVIYASIGSFLRNLQT